MKSWSLICFLLLLGAQEACGYSLRALPPTWHPHLRRVRLPDGTISLERRTEHLRAADEASALSLLQTASSDHEAEHPAHQEDCPCPADRQTPSGVEAQSTAQPRSQSFVPPLGQQQLQLLQVTPPVPPLANNAQPAVGNAPAMQAPVQAVSTVALPQALAAYEQQATMEMMQVNTMRMMESQLQNEEVQLHQQIQLAEANMQRQGLQPTAVAPQGLAVPPQPPMWPPMPVGSMAFPQFAPAGAVPGASLSAMVQPQQPLLQAPPMMASQAVPAAFPAMPVSGSSQPALLQYWR
mmetsp:Transcript_59939/g.111101  ORF Transcript_59939/g.111101 Transcript_59939/m.111101 type:complete len:294 (-) Transcript_59939:14-895(-)